MEEFYEQTWGWSDSGKRGEMKEDAALYAIGMYTDFDRFQLDQALTRAYFITFSI